ncbi:MAG: GNAT family N-acetyltransferase [Dehalococcoidales bacterium]|jgi:GNAT superfamily N-acetyltransferase
MKEFRIRPINKEDRPWIVRLLTRHWGSARSVTRGRIYQADALPGFVAIKNERRAGLITYHIDSNGCEITTINSVVERRGIGSAMVGAVRDVAVAASCQRLWLITTNDNTKALRFWQKRGFNIKALYPNAIARDRLLKPEIPLLGNDGIPIRDEIELELLL